MVLLRVGGRACRPALNRAAQADQMRGADGELWSPVPAIASSMPFLPSPATRSEMAALLGAVAK